MRDGILTERSLWRTYVLLLYILDYVLNIIWVIWDSRFLKMKQSDWLNFIVLKWFEKYFWRNWEILINLINLFVWWWHVICVQIARDVLPISLFQVHRTYDLFLYFDCTERMKYFLTYLIMTQIYFWFRFPIIDFRKIQI